MEQKKEYSVYFKSQLIPLTPNKKWHTDETKSYAQFSGALVANSRGIHSPEENLTWLSNYRGSVMGWASSEAGSSICAIHGSTQFLEPDGIFQIMYPNPK